MALCAEGHAGDVNEAWTNTHTAVKEHIHTVHKPPN